MWKILAVILVSVGGAPVGEPEHLYHPSEFKTKKACQDFEASPGQKEQLAQLLKEEKAEHAPNDVEVATLCVEVKPKGIDI